MASGLLSLKWNHHRSTFLHVLANIRQKESYCDVTLACAGKFYSAHKLVLSTCSEYFEEMFERTQCKHPVIVLKDIGADELEALLSYMYDGEVNVLQEHLSSLIKAAECLKIKGLAVADSDPTEHSGSKSSSKDKSSSGSGGGISSNSKDVHRSHNSTSNNSNTHSNSFQSDSSSRQFRNSSGGGGGGGGVKRPSLSSKLEDGPSKRRRPEPSSPARRHSSERPSSVPRGGAAAEGKDGGDDGASDGGDGGGGGGDDGGNGMDRPPSPADDQQNEDGGDDAQSFAEGLSEQTGVKAEPVEIIDSDDMAGFDHQAGDGGSHDASDAEFTEEKFAGGSAEANDPSLWGGGANNDMFSQPSTSSFTGQDGSNSNDNNTSGGGKGGGSSVYSKGTSSLSRRNDLLDAASLPRVPHTSPSFDSPYSATQPTHQPQTSTSSSLHGSPSHPPPTSPNSAISTLQYPSVLHSSLLTGLEGVFLPPDHGDSSVHQLQSDAIHHPRPLSADRQAFQCRQCPYDTNSLTNYRSHMRVHTASEPSHRCPLCPYVSTQTSNLKTHMKKHTGERPFKCAACTKSFRQHVHLHRHLNIHKKEGTTLSCPHCRTYVP